MLTLYTSIAVSSDGTTPKFIITSDCVEKVEVKKDILNQWNVFIFLKQVAAKNMNTFSRNYLKKPITYVNGAGVELITVFGVEPVSDKVAIAGNVKNAHEIKESIMSSIGVCGEK